MWCVCVWFQRNRQSIKSMDWKVQILHPPPSQVQNPCISKSATLLCSPAVCYSCVLSQSPFLFCVILKSATIVCGPKVCCIYVSSLRNSHKNSVWRANPLWKKCWKTVMLFDVCSWIQSFFICCPHKLLTFLPHSSTQTCVDTLFLLTYNLCVLIDLQSLCSYWPTVCVF